MDTYMESHVCLLKAYGQTLMFAYKHAYMQASQTFQPRNIYNVIIKFLHNFQICMFAEFPYFWKYRNLIIMEIKKLCKCGNQYISHWQLCSTVLYIIKVNFILQFHIIAHLQISNPLPNQNRSHGPFFFMSWPEPLMYIQCVYILNVVWRFSQIFPGPLDEKFSFK